MAGITRRPDARPDLLCVATKTSRSSPKSTCRGNKAAHRLSVYPEICCNYLARHGFYQRYDYCSAWCVWPAKNYALTDIILGEAVRALPRN